MLPPHWRGRPGADSLFLLALLGMAGPSAATAQSLARYQATSYTLHYASVNRYLLYFVRGSDTLGTPVSTRTLESRKATASPQGLTVWVSLKGVGQPFQLEETYTVDPTGRLLAVGGRPVAELPGARVDLFPRFPDGAPALTAGLTWTDTVSLRGQQPYGPTAYEARRRYRVLRMVDSLGTTIAQLVGEGRMHIRQGGWQDSAQTTAWWQDIAGPVADTVWFDAQRGVLLAAASVMDLAGTGGVAGGGSLPSGLRSSVHLGPP